MKTPVLALSITNINCCTKFEANRPKNNNIYPKYQHHIRSVENQIITPCPALLFAYKYILYIASANHDSPNWSYWRTKFIACFFVLRNLKAFQSWTCLQSLKQDENNKNNSNSVVVYINKLKTTFHFKFDFQTA